MNRMMLGILVVLAFVLFLGLDAVRPGVGKEVSHSEAARVWGGQLYVDHQNFTDSTKTAWCTGATYTGCGGGACEGGQYNDVSGTGGNRHLSAPGICGSRTCMGTTFTCGTNKRDEQCE